MANLASLPRVDEWAWWGRALWRAAAVCAGVTLLLSAWCFIALPGHAAADSAVNLEDTVFSSVNGADLTW